MWLAYAVGNLEKHGHEVLFLDAPAQGMGLEEVKTKVISFAPHMAVFDTSTPSIYNDINAAVEIKSALADLFVVLVGVHVSALPEATLRENDKIDAVAFGEYDATLVELALAGAAADGFATAVAVDESAARDRILAIAVEAATAGVSAG